MGALTPFGNYSDMQVIRSPPRPTESEAVGVSLAILALRSRLGDLAEHYSLRSTPLESLIQSIHSQQAHTVGPGTPFESLPLTKT